MKPAILKKTLSAGGVIFRDNDNKPEVALISTRGGRLWGLPKGMVEKGEQQEMAALREVKEESGLEGKIVSDLGSISYWYRLKEDNIKCNKVVRYFLMTCIGGDVSMHDDEVNSAEWFPIEEAITCISYKMDKEILVKAKNAIGKING